MRLKTKSAETIAGVWCSNRYQLRKALEIVAARYGGTLAQVAALIAELDHETKSCKMYEKLWPGQLPPLWNFHRHEKLHNIAPWLRRLDYIDVGRATPYGYVLKFGWQKSKGWQQRIANHIGSTLCVNGVEVRATLLPLADSICDWQAIDFTAVMRALRATFHKITVYEKVEHWYTWDDNYRSVKEETDLTALIVAQTESSSTGTATLRCQRHDQFYTVEIRVNGTSSCDRNWGSNITVQRQFCTIDDQIQGLERLWLECTIEPHDWPARIDTEVADELRAVAQQFRENLRLYNRTIPCISVGPI